MKEKGNKQEGIEKVSGEKKGKLLKQGKNREKITKIEKNTKE